MSRINLDNYEAFLLDLSEGRLSESEQADLGVFLLQHPELEIDLNDLSLPALTVDVQKFGAAGHLKRDLSFEDEERLIGFLEGTLSAEETLKVTKLIAARPELAEALAIYRKTILQPQAVEFPAKSGLKRVEEDLVPDGKLIAYFEDCLPDDVRVSFEKELAADPLLRSQLFLLQQTKLIPESKIAFPDRSLLYKEARVIALFSYRSLIYVAASLLLVAGLFVVFNSNQDSLKNSLASNPTSETKESVPVQQAATLHSGIDNLKTPVVNSEKHNTESHSPKEIQKIPEQPENIAKKDVSTEQTIVPVPQAEQIPSHEQNEQLLAVTPQENNELLASNVSRYTSIEDIEVAEDIPEMEMVETKKGLWERAVALARNANKLGLTAVNGEKLENQKHYKISVRSFSVEKK